MASEMVNLDIQEKSRIRIALAEHIKGLEKTKEGTGDDFRYFIDGEIKPYRELYERLAVKWPWEKEDEKK